jgi:site-specific DNA recombinase
MANTTDMSEYRGKRALILTRVSTAKQEESYSHAAQERKVREKLIAPLGLRIVDEARHVIRDTYSGLEYRYREALERILEMAERQEFDVLCMDVLDRGLGRKALARELFRMQLRELGVRILTTDPSDHADDDSLEGQIMRFFKGYKAEDEVNDFVRRTKDGKREKALGNENKGIPPQIIGTGNRLYGYEFVFSEKSIRVGYRLKLDIVHIEADGTEWTEVKVVIFIFESAANGVPARAICKLLNAKKIPTPYLSKGIRHKLMKEAPAWQSAIVGRILQNPAYYGEFHQNRTASVGRIPGHKAPGRRNTSEDEHVIIPIPAIVTKELALAANKRVAQNKRLTTRNNKTTKDCLLRGGFAKCAYCGTSLLVNKGVYTLASGEEVAEFSYNCTMPYTREGRCSGCCIMVDELDRGVAEYIIELIRDPSVVDKKIQTLQAANPAHKQQQRKLKNLNAILNEEETYRNNLANEMRKKTLSERTVAFLNAQLDILEQQEQEARRDLADQQRMQEKEEKLRQRIAEFHRQCRECREKLDDPQFTPTFKFLQDAVFFFGLSVTVWRTGTKPRYEIYTDPPEIVELLS